MWLCEKFCANMKTNFITVLCILGLLFGATAPCRATHDDDFMNTTADVLLVRPGCFIATILGTALFVVALPVTAISHSVERSAHTLVVRPAQLTFTRPLG